MNRNLFNYYFVAAIVVASCFISVSVGVSDVTVSDIMLALFNPSQTPDINATIVWELRLPRTLMAFLAGGGLAIAGLILQLITRNPLADPYLFGVSSGASLGAVLAIAFWGSVGWFSISVAAFLGSLLSIGCLAWVASLSQFRQIESLVLVGVALSFLFSAMTSLFLYWSDPQAISAIVFWSLGSFNSASWHGVYLVAAVLSLVMLMSHWQHRKVVALTLGDESAITLGLNVKQLRLVMLLTSALLTAVIVSQVGGIGFVGLMIPHIVRTFVSIGSSHSVLITGLIGGSFMLWVDLIARTLIENQELPIGIITSFVGSVFFVVALYSKAKRQQGLS